MDAEVLLSWLAQAGRAVTLIALVTGVVIMVLVRPRTRHHWACLYLFVSWTILSVVAYFSNMQGPAPTLAPLWLRVAMWLMLGSSCVVFIITSWQEWLHKAWLCRKPDAGSEICS